MFKDLKSIIPDSVKRAGISSKVRTNEFLNIFLEEIKKTLGSELSKKIKPLYIKNKTITIASLSETAVDALKKNEVSIINKVNKNIGEIIFHEIKYIT